MAEKEYIERGATCKDCFYDRVCPHIYDYDADRCGAFINKAEVVEVRHGEWVHSDLAATWHGKDECGECHYHTADRVDLSCFNYCPYCGAKMDGKG